MKTTEATKSIAAKHTTQRRPVLKDSYTDRVELTLSKEPKLMIILVDFDF